MAFGKTMTGVFAAATTAVLLVQVSGAFADDATKAPAAKPKHSIKEVMKTAYKGDTALLAKVVGGTATAEQKAQFLELTDALTGQKAPKGDQAAWEAKVTALVKASHDLLDTTSPPADPAAAVTVLKSAADCKACHTAHKGK